MTTIKLQIINPATGVSVERDIEITTNSREFCRQCTWRRGLRCYLFTDIVDYDVSDYLRCPDCLKVGGEG